MMNRLIKMIIISMSLFESSRIWLANGKVNTIIASVRCRILTRLFSLYHIIFTDGRQSLKQQKIISPSVMSYKPFFS